MTEKVEAQLNPGHVIIEPVSRGVVVYLNSGFKDNADGRKCHLYEKEVFAVTDEDEFLSAMRLALSARCDDE